ncbi:MAG: hypothetical protein RLZZ175_1944 [Bacteroidota bacterium]|jgi:hypothetical protein
MLQVFSLTISRNKPTETISEIDAMRKYKCWVQSQITLNRHLFHILNGKRN